MMTAYLVLGERNAPDAKTASNVVNIKLPSKITYFDNILRQGHMYLF